MIAGIDIGDQFWARHWTLQQSRDSIKMLFTEPRALQVPFFTLNLSLVAFSSL